MARLIKMPMPGYAKFNKSILGVPDSPYDSTFDSAIERSVDSDKNCTLRITLRIFYRQINPRQITSQMMHIIASHMGVPVPANLPVGMYPDADDNPHLIKEWSGAEWASFISVVKTQASLWDNKFWLVPPGDFSLFDIVENSWTNKSGAVTTRPNIKCAFNFEVAMSSANAHRSVDVVNILGPGFFRSHSGLYNTNDATVRPNSKADVNAVSVSTMQPVIAHEIGHALGQPHIGVLRNLSQCGLAIVMDNSVGQEAIPALYKGGSNADVCYGTRATAGDIDNIMGAGDKFSQENAKPWLERLPYHFNLGSHELAKLFMGISRWKIAMTEPRPTRLPELV